MSESQKLVIVAENFSLNPETGFSTESTVFGYLKRTLSQLIPVTLGQFADRCLPRVQRLQNQDSYARVVTK